MSKLKVVITTILFAVFSLTSAYSAGDAEAIKKLSSFQKKLVWML